MLLVIGLGNPGQKYKDHRHNIGFQILDALICNETTSFTEKGIFSAAIAQLSEMLLVRPTTFMNHSGISVRALQKQYPDAIVVVIYDDIDIELGEIKLSFGRGAGGHNGVQSIIDHLGTKDFIRIRVGVRPVHEELKNRILPPSGFETFLLSNFAPFEQSKKEEGVKKAIAVLTDLKTKTLEEVMNKYN